MTPNPLPSGVATLHLHLCRAAAPARHGSRQTHALDPLNTNALQRFHFLATPLEAPRQPSPAARSMCVRTARTDHQAAGHPCDPCGGLSPGSTRSTSVTVRKHASTPHARKPCVKRRRHRHNLKATPKRLAAHCSTSLLPSGVATLMMWRSRARQHGGMGRSMTGLCRATASEALPS